MALLPGRTGDGEPLTGRGTRCRNRVSGVVVDAPCFLTALCGECLHRSILTRAHDLRHPRGSSHALAALAESFELEQAALARGDTATLTETDSNDSKITV